jgi:methylated-DNA-[protein]-cysteine S-methyltransferase
MRFTWMESPVGGIMLAREDAGIRMIQFGAGLRRKGKPREPQPGWEEDASAFSEEVDQLHRYFAGELHEFRMDLEPEGTDFQREVWVALQQIPFGETINYGELARRIGKPTASRAVGAANGANPVGIVIPCHRVIGANGSLTGYGGGIENKERLLAHERVNAPAGSQPMQFGLDL